MGLGRINKTCTEALEILNSPLKLIAEADQIPVLMTRLQLEISILTGYFAALNECTDHNKELDSE